MSSSEALGDETRQNRAFWDAYADEYQAHHHPFISHDEVRWGLWQLPDRELGILGDVSGLSVLELGCGAGQFGLALIRQGARVVGIDTSERQLEHARRNAEAAGLDFEVLHGVAEALPFEQERFDLVVADHGANRFADPYRWVPECARVLRPGGLLAFSGGTPFEALCGNVETDTWEPRLNRDYFGLHQVEWPESALEFELPYGEWIRLFRQSGLEVEALVEVRPPEGAVSTYRNEAETAWARQWPMEQIWKARKPA